MLRAINPMKSIQIIATIIAFVSTSHAHIGWTLDECIEKYGKPKVVEKPTGTGYIFISDPYVILAIFGKDGKAKIVNYGFAPPDSKTSAETQKMHMESIINRYPEFMWQKIKAAEDGKDVRYAKRFDGSGVFIDRNATEISVFTREQKTH